MVAARSRRKGGGGMQLQICGAAREVTGSCYLVETGSAVFLVDCGMHQGGAKEDAQNRARFPFDPAEIDFVLLTHAHIDHSGLLPRLVKLGFGGSIYATPATLDLAEIMLLDSAHIQESEAEWRTRRARRAGRRADEALYTQRDAEEVARRFRAVEYEAVPGAGARRAGALPRRRSHPGLGVPGGLAGRSFGRGEAGLQRRRGPTGSADHPRPRDGRRRRLPGDGIHLWRPSARRCREPGGTALRDHQAGSRRAGAT